MRNDRIRLLADHSQNFGFLYDHEPLLVLDGAAAESYVYSDPDAAMGKTRRFSETAAKLLLQRLRVPVKPKASQVERIHLLNKAGVLGRDIYDAFNVVRNDGNQAVHTHYGNVRAALRCLKLCFEIGTFIDRALRAEDDQTYAFVPPAEPVSGPQPTDDADRLALAELRDELARYEDRLAEVLETYDQKTSQLEAETRALREAQHALEQAERDRARLIALAQEAEERAQELSDSFDAKLAAAKQPTVEERDTLIHRGQIASRQPRTEREVRREVDAMLRAAGWQVKDEDEVNMFAADGVAVREVNTASGPADYLLYVNRRLVGVVEAKREGTTLSSAEQQSGRYASTLKASQRRQAWRDPLPFRYETTAVETRFTNRLDPKPRARNVFSFPRPDTIARWMREADKAATDEQTMRARLYKGLPPLVREGLRDAQVRAVTGLEASLRQSKPRALIQMATGAGKTYAAITATYRLLKYGGAKRVLFLVDRNTLGEQAETEFHTYQTRDDGRKFTELYNVQRLTGADMLESSSVVITTVQRLYSMLKGRQLSPLDAVDDEESYERDSAAEVGYNASVPPETFDVVIIDECHRSIYGQWRAVLEYFDAFQVGLTATPVAQTFGFFQRNLVSEYSYAESVADGVNVDFEVYRIRTEIGENGAQIPPGVVVPMRNRTTRRQRYEQLDDAFDYTSSQLGRKVVSKGQLRTVIETFRERLFTDIFPPVAGRPPRTVVPKTLIFAVDDNHAEEIVGMVREVFDESNEFCQKITYRQKDAQSLIKQFRNSPELRIAVTVNMIATGTDIRPLECVFFLNEVKSWALFEQMKGRGTRTLAPAELQKVTPDIDVKDHFVIVDAVGVTDSPRVDARPMAKHTEKQISLKALLRKAGTLTLSLDEATTLASRISRLDRRLTPDERTELEDLAGHSLAEVVTSLNRCDDAEEVDRARLAGADGEQDLITEASRPLANPEFRNRLLEIRQSKDVVYDEVNFDRLLDAGGVERGSAPEQIADGFRAYVEENRDEIALLELTYRKGTQGKVVRQQLKHLATRIARPPHRWTPDVIWSAYEQLGKVAVRPGVRHGPADLIMLIRHELGLTDGLPVPHAELIDDRFVNWLARQEQAGVTFTEEQRWWLSRIKDVIARDAGFDEGTLDEVPFSERGGTDGFLHAFGDDRAEAVIIELNRGLVA
ncbi:type I restriction enzyme R subunit [Stackebrandtia albiflava]|uniref:Type I restriction enzyme R subunit n=1 Tax=Stackebrandtia albiflava TaxID=406432 RepID=A0A562UL88_9ACTN|nr:DEAD/DEAH box helicase family protein [Stackebrandtia albiflava]TWJ06372.1 type I restriction enzyme R subunit [Stackebrandtia albiflava]